MSEDQRYRGRTIDAEGVLDQDIIVMQLDAEEFRVIVNLPSGRREHQVRLPQHTRAGLGLTRTPAATLVEESFRFLLERKAANEIAERFLVPAIAAEYPEYPEEIRMRFG